jgi:outer membrane lipoprotein-sorting protein
MKKLSLLLVVFLTSFALNAQPADEILDTYFENIGGKEKLKALKGIKISAEVNQGMIIPLEIYRMADGKEMTSISLQGKTLKQGVFDGETLWSTNFMTQKAEKSTAEETANHKLQMNDFPDPFLDYKEKGYSIELMGKETIDGAETFKIKLTQTPKTIEGVKVDNIAYYFFETENFVPIAMQQEIMSGQGKGMISEITFSDYQEVDGIYFAFSMTMGAKGQHGGQAITIKKIEVNPEVTASEFEFPEQIETKEVDTKE